MKTSIEKRLAARKYYWSNPEYRKRMNASAREVRQDLKRRGVCIYCKKMRTKHVACTVCSTEINARMRERRKQKRNDVPFLVARYRSNAKWRCVQWELDMNTASKLFHGNCAYCGVEPVCDEQGNIVVLNGIDRVDNSIGYAESNCVTC